MEGKGNGKPNKEIVSGNGKSIGLWKVRFNKTNPDQLRLFLITFCTG